jgi:hypothetical protein
MPKAAKKSSAKAKSEERKAGAGPSYEGGNIGQRAKTQKTRTVPGAANTRADTEAAQGV